MRCYDYPSFSDTKFKNMGKYIGRIHYESITIKSVRILQFKDT